MTLRRAIIVDEIEPKAALQEMWPIIEADRWPYRLDFKDVPELRTRVSMRGPLLPLVAH